MSEDILDDGLIKARSHRQPGDRPGPGVSSARGLYIQDAVERHVQRSGEESERRRSTLIALPYPAEKTLAFEVDI